MPIAKKSAVKSSAKAAAKTTVKPAAKPARKPNPALMKPVQPDAVLAPIVGSKPLPRSEMTKKLWDYIKKNNLQDPKKRTMINADPALKAVFGGKKQVSMFEMTKLVSAHVK
ncbi:MAG: SWIB/MDM2 domain-containing protein [Phycisphaerae bacterium]|jgi:chromatin remodeling complex protein RSC6